MFCAGEKPFQVPENKSVILAPTIPFPHNLVGNWEFFLGEHFRIQAVVAKCTWSGHLYNSVQSVHVEDGSVDPE